MLASVHVLLEILVCQWPTPALHSTSLSRQSTPMWRFRLFLWCQPRLLLLCPPFRWISQLLCLCPTIRQCQLLRQLLRLLHLLFRLRLQDQLHLLSALKSQRIGIPLATLGLTWGLVQTMMTIAAAMRGINGRQLQTVGCHRGIVRNYSAHKLLMLLQVSLMVHMIGTLATTTRCTRATTSERTRPVMRPVAVTVAGLSIRRLVTALGSLLEDAPSSIRFC